MIEFSAVVVSRLDHDVSEVTKSIINVAGLRRLVIASGIDGLMERWRQIMTGPEKVWYTQDDDCIVDVAAVLEHYEPHTVTCNMPDGPGSHRADYPDGIALVGWGCVVDRFTVAKAMSRYFAYYSGDMTDADALTRREIDRVVTGLSKVKLVDVPFRHLAFAHGADRMGREARHGADLLAIRDRVGKVRGHERRAAEWRAQQ